MSPRKEYQKEIHDRLGFFATWLPGDHLELGAIGILADGRFTKAAALSEFGVTFSTSGVQSVQDVQYTSAHKTEVAVEATTKTSVGPGFPVSAVVNISLGHRGAFLFHASKLQHIQIEDRLALHSELLRISDEGNWDPKWILVDGLHLAECATVIVSEDNSTSLTISASAPISLGALPLANPQAHLTITSTVGRTFNLIGGRNVKPLYTAVRLGSRLRGGRKIEPVRGLASSDDLAVFRADIEELLAS